MADLAMGEHLAWIDVETTGLDPNAALLEVGLMVTDTELRWKGSWSYVIWHSTPPPMDDWCLTTHTNNGLIAELATGVPLSHAEAMLSGVIEQMFASPPPLCGSSVQFDRGVLERKMPGLAAKFHYRNGDVSSIKEFAGIWTRGLDTAARPQGRKLHRVIPDLEDSVDEARFYKERIFQT